MNALKDNYAINFVVFFIFFVNPGNPEKITEKEILSPPTHTLDKKEKCGVSPFS